MVKRYAKVMTLRDVLYLIRKGIYTERDGVIYGRLGKVVVPFTSRKKNGEQDRKKHVRLYYNHKRKAIRVSRLVWMIHTKRTIPKGFEIHHVDEDSDNDRWENLMCLHHLDHRKVHQLPDLDEVPF